ncbi:hypothetical protein GCM10011531_28090 [Aquaticitalea lipolytica]|jgi:hypothetical protein|uniref:Fn3-like domain-containing protein n=1 Tax=Aquaticitalea lipolytica TaxID=1247562 RepID=A0A8J2TUE9_9FLAO|nr:hypothetical protein [Aquaticitalea lipolytica]GFZ94743.1 hypothetical protein GCM10011531_28090 [Aquaticitalea lipolytica]
MKTIVTIIIVCLSTLSTFGQQSLSLKIINGSDKPNSETEHIYLLEVTNNSKSAVNFNISADDKSCSDTNLSQIEMKQEVLNSQKSKNIELTSIQPGRSFEFYIKISRPANAKLSTWNCTEVKAVSDKGHIISNSIIIQSLIPDPNNFN